MEFQSNLSIPNRKFMKIQTSKNRNPLKIDYSKHKILWNPFKYLFLLLEIDWKKCTQFPAKIGNPLKFRVPF